MGWYKKAQKFDSYDASANAAQSALLKLRYVTDQDISSMDIDTLAKMLIKNNLVPLENVNPERFAAMIQFLASQNGVLPD